MAQIGARTGRMRNRVVVVTGASSGIGRAIAEAFAREGADIVLAARRRDALEKAAAACRRMGAEALAVPTDVSDGGEMRALAAAAVERFGKVDVWVNNAGIGAIGAFDDTPLEVHRKIIDVNLGGVLNGAHAIVPHFRARGRGVLINMLSLGAWTTTPYAAAYSAAKFGARALSEAIRAELRHLGGIHVCDVYPTFVDTPGFLHAANYTGRDVRSLSGGVDPRVVAAAVLRTALDPRPTTVVGAAQAAIVRIAHGLAPQLTAALFATIAERALTRRAPASDTSGAILQPMHGGREIDNPRAAASRARRVAPGLAAAALIGIVGYAASRRSQAAASP